MSDEARLTTRMVRKQRSASAESSALLVVLKAGENSVLAPGLVIPIGQAASVGRMADSAVTLGDDSVSRDHAMFEHRADGWYLGDSGSTNGTFLAGRRIEGAVRLASRELVAFGEVQCLFWVGTKDDQVLAMELKKHGLAIA